MRELAPRPRSAPPSGPAPDEASAEAAAPRFRGDGPSVAEQASSAARVRVDNPLLQRAAQPGAGPAGLSPTDALTRLGEGAPLPPEVAEQMSPALGLDLSGVEVHPDNDVAPAIGARAFTVGHHVAFAPGEYRPDTPPGRRLLAHELAHVVQQARGTAAPQAFGGPADRWEAEAEAAADAIAAGGSAGTLSPLPPAVQRAPAPDVAESPFAATISREFATPGAPTAMDVKVTLRAPSFGDGAPVAETVVLHQPVLGATAVTAYQVPLGELYPSREAAAEARKVPRDKRLPFSIAGSPLAALERVAAKIAAAPKGPAPADAAGTATTPGTVVAAGPSPTTPPEVAYDLGGGEIHLVARSAQSGVTTEYTKLAVGAASTTVLKTPTGFSLIDAGVRHDGATRDPAALEYAIKRLKEIVGDHPIEEILISHAHLDHVGLLEAVSREFVIKQISINAIQLIDPRFLAATQTVADNQRALMEDRLRTRFRDQRAEWDANPELTRLIPNKGARDAHFDEWVKDQVALEMAKAPPIQVNVLTPRGSGVDASSVKLGGIDLVTKEASAPTGPGEGFSVSEYARATLADPRLQERFEELQARQKTDPNAKMIKNVDEMSSSYVLELPNGNQLVVVPDIRVDDIGRLRETLKTELGRLGAKAELRLWDMTHHMQSGFVAEKDLAAPPGEVGAIRLSQLENLTELLVQLTRTPSGTVVDAVTVSVDAAFVDPALVWLLRSCGMEVFTAQDERDVQFIEAETAAGRKVAGVARGRPYPGLRPSDPLLRRTVLALDRLREQQKTAEEGLAREQAQKGTEADAKKAELKSQRDTLVKQRDSLRGARDRAHSAAETPGKQQAKTAQSVRDQALVDAESALNAKVGEIGALDGQVAAIRQQGERLAPEVKRLKAQVEAIEAARKTYLKKIETISKSIKETSKASVAPPEGGESPFQAEEVALDALVRPVYGEAIKAADVPVIGETTLVVLGKGASTDAGRQLETERDALEGLRRRIAANDRPVEAHAELAARLQVHVEALKARSDAADPAVADAIALDEQQIELSQKVVAEAAAKGTKVLDRDATTGLASESSIITETSAEEAEKAEAPAEPGKFGRAFNKGMKVFGRAMGGVMVYQNITGATDLVARYGANQAGAGELTLGLSKSAYGVNIGYRMLKGAHVGMGEFAILSVLDVAQTALANYDSSEQFNTEVTYALIRNAVNLACAAIGTALIETANPIGIVAGLVIMFLGDPILEALGLHDWLAKKFDFRPDEYIDLEKDLVKLLDEYSVVAGALQLQARSDESLQGLGNAKPSDLREAAAGLLQSRRAELQPKERSIMDEFEAAYTRAKEGYSQLREIDELRAQFLELYLKAHHDDPDIKKASTWGNNINEQGQVIDRPPGPLTIAEVEQRFGAVEGLLGQEDISVAEVPRMEQWSKMDKWIGTLEGYLYATDPGSIDWMKVSEAERNLLMMVSNAHYRLDPAAQSKERQTAIFPPDSEQRRVYERLLLERENKLDQLRQRTVDVAVGAAVPVVLDPGGTECDVVDNAPAVACYTTPATYAGADYGDVTTPHSLATQLKMASATVASYRLQIARMPGLPGTLTAEGLFSRADTLAGYHDAAMDNDNYKSALFALKASSTATASIVGRLREVAHGLTLSKEDEQAVKDVLEAQRVAEQDRRVQHGYLFLEEIPALTEKINTTRTLRLGAVFGDPETHQLTKEEHAAVASDALKGFQLGTLSDRLMAADVHLPDRPDVAIPGVFRLVSAPAVLVAVQAPGDRSPDDVIGPGGESYFPMVPINAAAIARFGGLYVQYIGTRDFQSVTMADVQAMKTTEPK